MTTSSLLFIASSALLVCMGVIFYASHIPQHINRETLSIFCKGGYSEPLRAILQKTSIHADGTLSDLVAKTQKSQLEGGWMRAQGLERWELPYADATDTVWYREQFDKMGFMDEARPSKDEYTYAVVFGATIQGMRTRLAYLLHLILSDNLDVEVIVFLVGQRPRDEKKESLDVLFKEQHPGLPFKKGWQPSDIVAQTETDLAYLIIDQSEISDTIKERIIIIDTPMTIKPDGTRVRPVTEDTVCSWLKTDPKKGSILCISSQPHVERQLYVTQRLFPKEWNIECVGSAADPADITPSLILDTLARTLFELERLQKSKGLLSECKSR